MSMAEFKQNYIAQRIDDQIAYYQRQEGRALPQFVRLKIGFWITTLLAISCTFVYAVARTWDYEPAKWVAKIRSLSPSTKVLLRTELGAGHGGPSGRYDAWREEALVFAFLLQALGMLSGPVETSPAGVKPTAGPR